MTRDSLRLSDLVTQFQAGSGAGRRGAGVAQANLNNDIQIYGLPVLLPTTGEIFLSVLRLPSQGFSSPCMEEHRLPRLRKDTRRPGTIRVITEAQGFSLQVRVFS